jgi:hypothetical protein
VTPKHQAPPFFVVLFIQFFLIPLLFIFTFLFLVRFSFCSHWFPILYFFTRIYFSSFQILALHGSGALCAFVVPDRKSGLCCAMQRPGWPLRARAFRLFFYFLMFVTFSPWTGGQGVDYYFFVVLTTLLEVFLWRSVIR